jgi:hypothetical protein
LLEADAVSVKDGGENLSPGGGELIAMGGRNLLDQPVRPEDAQEARNAGASRAFLLGGLWGSVVEEGLEIAVAEAVDVELASEDGSEEAEVVLVPRAQGADALTVVGRGATDTPNEVSDGGGGATADAVACP